MTAHTAPGGSPRVAMPAGRVPDRQALGRIARGSSANLAGAVVFGATNTLVTLLVTRTMAPERAGAFFAAISVFLIAFAVSMLGTGTGMVYFIARSRALNRVDLIPRYFRVGTGPMLVVGVALSVAIFVWAPVIVTWMNAEQVQGAATYIRASAALIPLAALENSTLAATRGLRTMRPTVLIEQVGRSLLQVALVGIVVLVPAPQWLGLAWALPYLPAAVVALIWWRRLTRQFRPDGDTARRSAEDAGHHHGLAGSFWRFTGPRALSRVAQQSMQRLDILLVAALATPAAAAVYTAATRFIVLGQTGNRAISTAVQPHLAHSLATLDIASARHYYQAATSWLMLLTWPLYLTLLVLGPQLLTVFGSTYDRGASILVILAVTMLFATCCGMVDMVLTMAGRTSWNLVNSLVGLAVNLGLDVWLIPDLGYTGAALGWGAAIVIQNVLALTQVGLSLGLHPFGRVSLLAGLLPLACFGLIEGGVRLVFPVTWTSTVAALAVACCCYLGVLFAFREPLEISALCSAWRRRRARVRPPREKS